MPKPTIYQIAEQLNFQAAGYAIGKLQEIRAQLKGLRRIPSRLIFTPATISDAWAFHLGGRSELQFNIGLETLEEVEYLRHGVAFSLETSRTLPSIDVLIPKIRLFNEFVADNSEALSGFEMWHWSDGRSPIRSPATIAADLIKPKTFIFLGSLQPITQVDYAKILADFDLLLPLYKFVESNGTVPPYKDAPPAFAFRAGNRIKKSSTALSSVERQLSVALRHNVLQAELYSQLCVEYGSQNVGTEINSGSGGRIDVVVNNAGGFTFFEIKVGRSLQGCMREAIGQLLEYSYWPRSHHATYLIVAGEPALDGEGREFLEKLQQNFSIPIGYRQIVCNEASQGDAKRIAASSS